MVLYDEEGKMVKYDESNHIGKMSHSGSVYMVSDDTCIKTFELKDGIDIDTIKLINDMKLDNFYEIKGLLFNKKGLFSGYTMRYYKSDIYDILKMPSEYTLKSFNNICKSIERLTKEGVLVSDLHQDNAILTHDGIIVIDVDSYYKSKYFTKEQIQKNNYNAILYLFKKLFLESLETYVISYEEKEALSFIITNLFKKDNINNTCRELSQYDYPIDYIRSKVRRRLL